MKSISTTAVSAALLLFFGTVLQARPFRVAFLGDPQVDSEAELDYARRTVYRELRSRSDIDLVVVLGDLVNNRMDLLEGSKASLDSLRCPWVCAPGNHDKDQYPKGSRRPRDLESFRRVIGYTDTTFVAGGVRFISMDDVCTVKVGGYEGALRAPQKEWLRSVVASSREECVVFCTHIPVSWCRDRDSLLAILAPCPKLLLVSGHSHFVHRHADFEAAPGVEEVIAGAGCGLFWRGLKDERGIPSAIMNCGAPRGYFVADFRPGRRDGWYRLGYKAENRDGDEQCSVSVQDSTLVVNVYGGSEEGKVEVRLDGKWKEMPRSRIVPTEVREVVAWNRARTKEYRRAHKEEFIPMRSIASPHVWALENAGDVPARVKLRYSDPAMGFTRLCGVSSIRLPE